MRNSAAGAGAATAARELLAAPPAVGGVLEALDEYPLLLRVEEAAEVLRIGRSLAYELARRYESSDSREGLPVMRLGSCLRVPRWALAELVATGQVVRLVDPTDS